MLSVADRQRVAVVLRMYDRRIVTEREVMGLLRDVANGANTSEIQPLLPDDLARRLTDNLARQPALRGVGYWRPIPKYSYPKDDRFPDPTSLVCPNWCEEERSLITAYLRDGRTYNQWRGISYCRFKCGVLDENMGSRCLTDGEWVWPEGLSHYVECHAVRLPDEFVVSMRRNEWQVPLDAGGANREDHGLPETSFWIAWGQSMRSEAAESDTVADRPRE